MANSANNSTVQQKRWVIHNINRHVVRCIRSLVTTIIYATDTSDEDGTKVHWFWTIVTGNETKTWDTSSEALLAYLHRDKTRCRPSFLRLVTTVPEKQLIRKVLQSSGLCKRKSTMCLPRKSWMRSSRRITWSACEAMRPHRTTRLGWLVRRRS